MNDVRHPDLDDLAAAGTLPADHPVRRHLQECARCQSRVLAFERFVAEPSDVPAAERAEARRSLHEALRAEMGMVPRMAAGRLHPPRERRSFGAFLRPALAALLVVAAGVWVAVGPTPWRGRPDVLRETGGRALVEIRQIAVGGDELAVRWKAVAGADAYRVSFYTADLLPFGDPALPTKPELRVPVATFREAFEADRWLYVRVVALRAGEEIADSGPRSFRSP